MRPTALRGEIGAIISVETPFTINFAFPPYAEGVIPLYFLRHSGRQINNSYTCLTECTQVNLFFSFCFCRYINVSRLNPIRDSFGKSRSLNLMSQPIPSSARIHNLRSICSITHSTILVIHDMLGGCVCCSIVLMIRLTRLLDGREGPRKQTVGRLLECGLFVLLSNLIAIFFHSI